MLTVLKNCLLCSYIVIMECVCFETGCGISGCKITVTRWSSFQNFASSCLWITIPILSTVNEFVLYNILHVQNPIGLCAVTNQLTVPGVCASNRPHCLPACAQLRCVLKLMLIIIQECRNLCDKSSNVVYALLSNRVCCGGQWNWDTNY